MVVPQVLEVLEHDGRIRNRTTRTALQFRNGASVWLAEQEYGVNTSTPEVERRLSYHLPEATLSAARLLRLRI